MAEKNDQISATRQIASPPLAGDLGCRSAVLHWSSSAATPSSRGSEHQSLPSKRFQWNSAPSMPFPLKTVGEPGPLLKLLLIPSYHVTEVRAVTSTYLEKQFTSVREITSKIKSNSKSFTSANVIDAVAHANSARNTGEWLVTSVTFREMWAPLRRQEL